MAKGNPDVIEILNEVLTGELTAINQYFLHAEMCRDWGYERLYTVIRKESIDEMKHAERLIERILYLEGLPNVQKLGRIRIGETVEEQFRSDRHWRTKRFPDCDEGSRFASMQGITELASSWTKSSRQRKSTWIGSESQLELIDQVGVQNYLAAQIRPE